MARQSAREPDSDDGVPSDLVQAPSGEAREDSAPQIAPSASATPASSTGPRYRVVGPHAVLGVEPGGVVDLVGVTPGEFRVLMGAGHIAGDDSAPEPEQDKE